MWWLKSLMGTNNSTYLDELSDDSDDEDFDYSLQKRDNERDSCLNNNANMIAAPASAPQNLNIDVDNKVPSISNSEMSLTTDAFAQTFLNPVIAVRLETTLDIEQSLDYYEMVSLVYLLYDDPNFALQELTLLLHGAEKNLLHNWAQLEECHGHPWQKKLVEALCIIKNYEVLCPLGYKKHDLIMHYLPHLSNSITNLNPIKKAIYLMCEKLNRVKTDTFLEIIKVDFQGRGKTFPEYGKEYLELYFLDWEASGYISVTDLTNLKRVLKVMEDETLWDMLEKAFISVEKTEKKEVEKIQTAVKPDQTEKKQIKRLPSTSTDTHRLTLNSGEAFGDFQSPLPSMGEDNVPVVTDQQNDSHKYKIDPENPGVLLIINQELFYTEIDDNYTHLLPQDIQLNKLESRTGTEKDKIKLTETFESFGFKVVLAENLTHEELVWKIEEVVQSITEESSLFVCILSHGDEGVIYGVNSCEVKVSEIQELMCKTNKKNLRGKPKILILQSCRGRYCQILNQDDDEYGSYATTTDGPSCAKRSIPEIVDLFTFWASYRGYAAIRNKNTGSWFIQALCHKMAEVGNRIHFVDICTRIAKDVTDKVWVVNNNANNAMVPTTESTLRKDFYLPPKKG